MKTFLAAFSVLFLTALPCSAQHLNTKKLESFELVWQTVNRTHFDSTFGGIDWQAMRDRYRPDIESAEGIEAFSRIANQMLFELGLSHLLVADEKMLKTYLPTLFAEGGVGLDVRWIENRAIVTRVRPGSPGLAAGVKPGAVITRIGGWAVDEIVRQALLLPPCNMRNRRGGIANYLMGHIDGPADASVSITFLDGNGREKQVVMARRSRGEGQVLSEALPPAFITFEAKRLPGDIGYFRFNHFAPPVDTAFAEALEGMRDTRGLIFDLRGNPGGYFRVMDAMVEHLISEKTALYQFRLRDKRVERVLTPVLRPYENAVIVLIDVTSTSCSEHFAACLQAIGRATIVGERSPGYLLGAEWMRLPNGLSLMHTILQPIPSDGRIVEGHGVRPDVEVVLTRDDLLDGRDTQLEAAVTQILGTKQQQ
jgi:carboxyl-terminal processing protease